MKRALRLNKETLTELSADVLAGVVGGDSPTHRGCTMPLNHCALSVSPCQSVWTGGTDTGECLPPINTINTC